MSGTAPAPLSPPSPLLRWVVAVAFFMQMLDSTILNTALPAIARDLAVNPLATQSAVIAYLLTTALLMPASGWLAERFGTRRIFFLAIIMFTLGSVLCAASPSLNLLTAARVVQGIGGALMVPVGRLSILRAYPRQQLIHVMSFITIPGLIGPLLGPVVGGFLVQYASWHWIFLLNLPAGVLGLILAWRCMPDFRGETSWAFDTYGFLLFGLATLLITFSMEGMGDLHLPKIEVTLLCISGLMLFGLYWVRAAHTEHPLFSASMFRIQTFAVGILGNLFARLGAGGMPFLLPLFLQLGLGLSPFMAGLTMTPTALAGMLGKEVVPKLVARFGYRRFLSANTVIVGGLIASFSLVGKDVVYPILLAQLAVFGVFNSMQLSAMNSVALLDLEDQDTGSGNSLLSVTMQIAATCGVATAAALLNGFNSVTANGVHTPPSSGVFENTFLAIGILTVFTGLIFSHIPPESGKE